MKVLELGGIDQMRESSTGLDILPCRVSAAP
jgi:hypothetical protein